jgi:hypothetical protein
VGNRGGRVDVRASYLMRSTEKIQVILFPTGEALQYCQSYSLYIRTKRRGKEKGISGRGVKED